MDLRGVFYMLPTPFDEWERIDVAQLEDLVEWVLARDVHGLTILGVAGEAYRLLDEERDLVAKVVLARVAGRMPVVVGAGHPGGTAATIEYCRRAMAAGAASVMVAPPFVARPTRRQIVEFYGAVAEALQAPIVVQDEPHTTGLQMPVGLFEDIVAAAPLCRYAKIEEVPTPPKFRQLTQLLGDERLRLFGGTGGLYFAEELQQGAQGIMTGFAFPEALLEIWRRFEQGDEEGALTTSEHWLPLLKLEGLPGIGLVIRKRVLQRRGALTSSRLRAPAPELDPSLLGQLDRLLARYEGQASPVAGASS